MVTIHIKYISSDSIWFIRFFLGKRKISYARKSIHQTVELSRYQMDVLAKNENNQRSMIFPSKTFLEIKEFFHTLPLL